MSSFLDLSSPLTEESLLRYYSQCDIDDNAEIKYIEAGHPLDYSYRSPNQISTIKTEDENVNQRVLTYNTAQNYYQSERARILSGPERAERARLSNRPFEDGYVPEEDYRNNKQKWKDSKFDVAFKCNWLKFTQNQDLQDELLRTGNRPLVPRERNDWSDTNAKILTIIREDLQRR